ncbi:hypothetical protein [Rhizobium leguminosarum]|uniref:hypothetical protein n=1 Tax=Rhizobium leguminosarum TaxID=384 RepID=UPI0021BC3176|nr:hypothetical protein [Rhizobium leguminosarum]
MTATLRAFACLADFALTVTFAQGAAAEEHQKGKVAAKPVETGVVIRGVTLAGPVGNPGTSTGKTCDFSGEPVDPSGRLEGASVNCRPNGTRANTSPRLPARFNAYCMINAPVKRARLIQAARPENANHCDLSGITPKDATGQFGGGRLAVGGHWTTSEETNSKHVLADNQWMLSARPAENCVAPVYQFRRRFSSAFQRGQLSNHDVDRDPTAPIFEVAENSIYFSE